MREPNIYVVLSHGLIGAGFFFLYMQHVRIIFETRTNIQNLNQLQRESLLRREDALYFSFYKVLTNGPDFWHGYEQLKNITEIEYPHSVNVLKRFYVLPELATAYLYHLVRSSYHPILEPMQFYFEFVWIMGGITLLVLYLYGTLLSENVFGGIYGVISYLMFHSFASKIYERPLARENFAFPFIFLQMFYLCIYIVRIFYRQRHTSRIFMIFVMSLFTACALLSWQFSSVIFTSQLFIIMMAWSFTSMPVCLSNSFALDFSLSHLFGLTLAFVFSHGNKQLLFTWQLSVALSLLLISLIQLLRSRLVTHDPLQNDYFSLKLILLSLLLTNSMQSKMLSLLGRSGVLNLQEDTYMHYCDLLAFWIFKVKASFVTNLSACNPMYGRVGWSELWQLIKTLVVKPYCMYGVVMLSMFFRKWRKTNTTTDVTSHQRERAFNYVLEDFLEEHHVSISDLSNKETEDQLAKCIALLEKCNHDYERYKREKANLHRELPYKREEFIQDIKRLKAQIHRNSDKQRREHLDQKKKISIIDTANERKFKESAVKNMSKEKYKEILPPIKAGSTSSTEGLDDNSSETPSIDYIYNDRSPKPPIRRDQCISNNSNSEDGLAQSTLIAQFLNLHYMYSFMQMVVFAILGLSIRKLFFLSFTQGCVIAPTVCSKVWYHGQRNIFWSVSLAVFLLSMFDPGMINIRDEYFPTSRSQNTDELDGMLEWIKLNTENNAVFAGPIEIIGTVHLTTRRPIVNHAHLEMRQIAEQTEHVYSIYSRQQSSDIYSQCAQLKIQYLIVSLDDCTDVVQHDCGVLSIWDEKQPAYRKHPQFCHELLQKNVPSFLRIYTNDKYSIIKMFSHSVQINLKQIKMSEMSI